MNRSSLECIIISMLVFLGTGVSAQYDRCTGNVSWIGDGWCDDDTNNAECGYDGGDCCYCSCADGADYSCGVFGFDCRDPEYVGHEIFDCIGELLIDAPCPSGTSIQWTVNDTSSANTLADAILCSGGVFNVQWLGQVFVNRTIKVANGTVLRLAGVGSGAKIQAGSSNRLFTVINASLSISNIQVAGGNATFGGAIAAARSNLSFENTSFTANSALVGGGALHATLGSITSYGDGVVFEGNHAGDHGGALSLGAVPDAAFHGYMSFTNNTAEGYGGAMFVSSSNIAWAGDASFSKNTASFYGGALFIRTSEVVWADDAFFRTNEASEHGGALFVLDSKIYWAGEASFSDNTADIQGGALYIDVSDVVWAENVSFRGNTANHGGALILFSSNSSWTGDAFFSDNTAKEDGGALYASSSRLFWAGGALFCGNTADFGGALILFSSSISWAGDAFFSDNTAKEDGGALYAFSSHVFWAGDAFFFNNAADKYGGALILWHSIMFWASDASFTGNINNELKGSLHVRSSDASWAGNTSFLSNTSKMWGGAICVFSSEVYWEVDAFFSDNIANRWGGALLIMDSNVSWLGDALFLDNTAEEWGGALYVGRSNPSSSSHVSWVGEASFSNNTAKDMAGAIFIDSSEVSWALDASFSGNTAKRWGGALFVFGANASWLGDALFSDNTAEEWGGALYVSHADQSSSYVSWVGDASFSKNTAKKSGGAICALRSQISSAGDTLFSKNTAERFGGALFFDSSNISWEGDASFSENTANSHGGALLAFNGSYVSWRKRTFFVDNESGGKGGALYIHATTILLELGAVFLRNTASSDGGAVFIHGSDSRQAPSFRVSSSAIFLENTCGLDGGALAMVTARSLKFATTNVTFSRNSANAHGGAVAVKGSGVGPQFTGLTFVSNRAQAGGAAYITSSGTATTEDEHFGVSVQHPTTFDRCKFIGNQAAATGGAVESRAGLDVITNTYFAGNAATGGGALRLAGIASLHNCTLTENTSDDGEGPAVSNVGFVESMTSCSFLENSFNCEAGEFLDYHHTNASNVVLDVVCKGCDVECEECTTPLRLPVCTEELEHTKSHGGNLTIEALEIDQGYWRATNTSRNVLKCYNADACLGGVTGASDYCSAGYEGPYCSICREGYSPGVGRTCSKCSGGIGPVVVIAIVASSALLVAVLLLSFLTYCKPTSAARELLASRRRRLLSVKIIIIVWQVLTQFSSMANVMYPGIYQRFLGGISILNLDLSWILSVECIIDVNFHHRLLMSTLGPPVVLAFLGAMYAVYRRRNWAPVNDFLAIAHDEASHRYLPMVLLLSFLVYSSVSSTLFQMFSFDKLDDGKGYLRADYRIDYNSLTHITLQIYAACMMLVYTVGIPVLYGTLLFRNRQVLMDESTRQDDAAAKSISSLWELYKPDRFYYDLIECARRILLAGVVVFIFPNTVAQVAVALMLTLFFMVLSEMLAPYESVWDAWINRIGHAIIFGSIYLALLLKIDVSDERQDSERLFESILIGGHAFMFLLVTFEGVVVVYQWVKRRS